MSIFYPFLKIFSFFLIGFLILKLFYVWYFQMGTAAMDALKYGSYMSGLYGSMANSSTSTTDPTNTTSNSNGGGNKSPYMNSQQEMSPKSYDTSSKSYESSNNGVSSVTSAATSIAASGKIITMKVN